MWKWYQPFECFIIIVGERIISANGPDPYKQSSTALIPVAVVIPEVKRRPLQWRLCRDMYHFYCSPPDDFTHPPWRHDETCHCHSAMSPALFQQKLEQLGRDGLLSSWHFQDIFLTYAYWFCYFKSRPTNIVQQQIVQETSADNTQRLSSHQCDLSTERQLCEKKSNWCNLPQDRSQPILLTRRDKNCC